MPKITIKLKAEDLKKKLGLKDGKQGPQGPAGHSPVLGIDYEIPTTGDVAREAAKIAFDKLRPLIPQQIYIEKELFVMGTAIRDGLEQLQGDERLDISAIKGLEDYDEISRLAREPKIVKKGGTFVGGGAKLFTQLTDVPHSYSGQTLKAVRVKSDESGLEFYTPASSGVSSVTGTTNRITSTGGTTPVIDISASYVGQSSITTLGTVSTGAWNGTAIDLANYVTGNLSVSHLNSGSGASSSTYWRGDGSWASISASPGGSPTQLQYNNSGSFDGISGSSVNATTRAVGFNKTSPAASVHAGTYSVSFPTPSGSTAIGNTTVGSTGYPFSTNTVTYNAYAAGLINGVTTFSSTYDTFAATEPLVTNYNATSSSCGINTGGTGYNENNDFFLYQIYGLYGSNISVNYTQCNYGPTSSSGNPFSNSVSWTAPANTVGLTGYVIVRNWSAIGGDYYQVLGTSTSFNDDNTGWIGGDPSNPQILWNANLTIGSVAGVTNYVTFNASTNSWIDTGGTPTLTDSNDFPNSGVPTVTPNTYEYESLISDGKTELCKIDGSFAIFGASPQTQQTGDVAGALDTFGFTIGGFIPATKVQYENGQVLESGHAIYDYSGNLVIDSGGGVTATTGLYTPMATGVDSNGKATFNGIKNTTLSASQIVLTDSSKNLISASILSVALGGTNIASYAVGDIIYASASTTLSKLADVATGNALISGGVTTSPSWGKIGLTTHVSGTLPVANGGIGATTLLGAGIATITNVTLTNQSADIAATNLGTVAGLYLVSYSLQDTTADLTAGAVILTLSYTDGAGAATVTATQTLVGVGRQSGSVYVQLASGNLTYATTHTGIFGTSKYALFITTARYV